MIESCRERLDRGDAVDFEREIAAHPRVARRLRAAFAMLATLERTLAATPPSLVGATLGPWRVCSRLGAGGMGEVFLCEDGAGARAAVKVVHAHLLARPGYLDRFRREAGLGRRIRHENVVATREAADWPAGGATRHCLVMEYVEGRTLRQLADELGRVPEALCRHIGRETAKGLAAIHAAGVVHRDLKPDNVIVTKEHVVKVMDLGVARFLEDAARLSQSAAFVGSFHYAAPEQFRRGGKDVDARADLFALGLVLYELSTGAHPFPDDDVHVVLRKLMDERPRPLAELNPQLSPFFEEVVAKLLAKDPSERFASADEVARVLDEGEESSWWKDRALALRAATRRPLRRIRIPRETALYGREAELALLRSLYERAKAGYGQVAVVEGEAGIGKSRLVDEFVGALAQAGEDVNFLFGSYPPGGAATASGAFSTAYREHLGDDEESIRAALTQTPLLVPAFAALLRGDATPEGAEPLTKDSLQTVFVHATRSLSAERTTIVLIDDLHFAPEEGRALFASLALAAPGHRVLLVGCARRGLDEKWVAQLASRPQTTRLSLPRLGPKELVHLLRDALKSERLADELAGLIGVKSDGNPFFVFELLRGLRDGQFLRQRPDGTWETTQIIRDIQVPSSIAELVQARVADLGPEDKNLLDVASCCGFEFDPLVVGQALRRDRVETLQALGRIEKRHRLVRSAGRRFVFDHHQVQEALYAGLSELLREEYHAMLGETIEARSGAASRDPKDVDGAVCVEVAEHFLSGAQGERALRYLDAALTYMQRNYRSEAAAYLAERALATAGLVTDRARVDLLLRVCRLTQYTSRRVFQRTVLEEALTVATAAGDRTRIARVQSQWGLRLFHDGRHDEARATLTEALELAQAVGDSVAQLEVMCNLGNLLDTLGRYDEAHAQDQRYLDFAQRHGDRGSEIVALGNQGLIAKHLGRYAEARKLLERSLELAIATRNRRAEARAAGNLGSVAELQGRAADAKVLNERQLELAREIGDRLQEAIATGNLGTRFSFEGRYADALARCERHLDLSREIGFGQGERIALVNLGGYHNVLGNPVLAEETLCECLARCRRVGDRRVEGYALFGLALVAENGGRLEEALRHAEASLELRRTIGYSGGAAESLLQRGRLHAGLGEHAAARADLGDAAATARDLGLASVRLMAAAHAAASSGNGVDGVLAAFAEHEACLGVGDRMELCHVLWSVTRVADHLASARRWLDFVVAHAPPECREAMLANVHLHREIASAARAHGLPLAADAS